MQKMYHPSLLKASMHSTQSLFISVNLDDMDRESVTNSDLMLTLAFGQYNFTYVFEAFQASQNLNKVSNY